MSHCTGFIFFHRSRELAKKYSKRRTTEGSKLETLYQSGKMHVVSVGLLDGRLGSGVCVCMCACACLHVGE